MVETNSALLWLTSISWFLVPALSPHLTKPGMASAFAAPGHSPATLLDALV